MIFFVQLLFIAAGLSTLAFASKPITLATATAVQATTTLKTGCQVKSHAVILAERKRIAAAIAQAVNEPGEQPRIVSPLIQIVASYCAMPRQWQIKRELRLPDNKPSGEAIAKSRVKSVAELADNKIFVKYVNGLGVTWNLSGNNSVPTFLPADFTKEACFYSATGQDDVLIADLGSRTNEIALINALTGQKENVAVGDASSIASHIYYPGAYCAVSLNGKNTVHLLEKNSEGSLVHRSLGSLVNQHSYLFDRRYGPSTEIRAMCPLQDGRLAVGDGTGNLGIVQCSDGRWEEPLLRVCNHVGTNFDIQAIVAWPEGIIAVLSDSREVGKSGKSISWWDVKQNKKLEYPSTPESINGIGALPNKQIAIERFEGKCGIDTAIYTVIYDEKTSSIKLELTQTLANKAQRWSYTYDLPLHLRKFTLPTLAIPTKDDTVQILEEGLCPDCESTEKIKAVQQEASCS